MKSLLFFCILFLFISCGANRHFILQTPTPKSTRINGTEFFKKVNSFNWKDRDSIATKEILEGNMPAFNLKFVPINSEIIDSQGIKHTAIFFVSPDYLAIGSNADWARVPLTFIAAKNVANFYNCFLPTRKMVDLIYNSAQIKLEPVPLYAFRDSSITMWQHHLIIEGQRKGKKGLIAGIKKDVVNSSKILTDPKPDREAIYGWHQLNGIPIQPLYSGHINWYVDYSHGIRLVYKIIMVDGKKMDFKGVLNNPILSKLICDEDNCNF